MFISYRREHLPCPVPYRELLLPLEQLGQRAADQPRLTTGPTVTTITSTASSRVGQRAGHDAGSRAAKSQETLQAILMNMDAAVR